LASGDWLKIPAPLQRAGRRIRWIEGQDIYLDPDAAFAAAQKLAQSQGTSLPITQQTLWKRLAEKRYLLSTDPGRNTMRLTVAGKRPRVIHLDKTALGGVDELDIPLPENLHPGDCGAKTPTWTEEADRKTEDIGKTVH
jgi:hypothetical protein